MQLFGMTCPLLLTSDGKKMGKTEKGAVWLSADKTSPYAFYQYFVNVADADVLMTLKFLSDIDREEIESLEIATRDKPHERLAQKRLAESLTQLVHGPAGLESAQQATRTLFGAEIDNLKDNELLEIFADVPSCEQPRSLLSGAGQNIVDAFCTAKLAASKSEGRRIVEQGGAYVNNRRIDSLTYNLTESDLASESVIVLRSGKRKYALLRFV